MSAGQVQLTLNCLALELEHLNVPEGPEEWSVDRVPPPSPASFFSAPLDDFVGGRVTVRKNGEKNKMQKKKKRHIYVFYFENEYRVCWVVMRLQCLDGTQSRQPAWLPPLSRDPDAAAPAAITQTPRGGEKRESTASISMAPNR